jgi:glyoxylase-like metal-dependent hydrolase (beta-lactamase superfamily II)
MTYTIRQILTGYQYLDKGNYATFRDGYGEIIEFPVFAFLLEGNNKKILIDTGMSDTEHSVKYHHDGRQEEGQAIHEQLAKLGISPDEIDMIIFTHLHWDHCYNLEYFQSAELVASKKEYEFAMNPIPFYWGSYEYPPATGLPPPFADRQFTLTEGVCEIMPGIEIFPTPGHSPGHIGVSVNTTDGNYVMVGDLMFLRDNMKPKEEKGWPLTPPGRFCNILEIWESIEEVMRRVDPDHVLMTHDPSQLNRVMYP